MPGGAVRSGSADSLKIDLHAHLAGVGTDGSGCWVSPQFRRRPTFLLLRLLHGIGREAMRTSADADWAARLAALARGSELDRVVALGFDGVYDKRGELDPQRSQLVVPPAWVFRCSQEHRELLPGPSVNPNRRDALERLDECIERGAVLLKWLPVSQAIDPGDRALIPFYRRMAEAGLPLLVHAGGGEQTFAMVAPAEVGDVARLALPLEQGVRVICAHAATPIHYRRERNQIAEFRGMLERYPNLWADNSGLANPSRFGHLPRLAADGVIRERTLFGTDWPVPSNAVYYVGRLGWSTVRRLNREGNLLQRDLEIKRALGFPEATLARAASVLRLAVRT